MLKRWKLGETSANAETQTSQKFSPVDATFCLNSVLSGSSNVGKLLPVFSVSTSWKLFTDFWTEILKVLQTLQPSWSFVSHKSYHTLFLKWANTFSLRLSHGLLFLWKIRFFEDDPIIQLWPGSTLVFQLRSGSPSKEVNLPSKTVAHHYNQYWDRD